MERARKRLAAMEDVPNDELGLQVALTIERMLDKGELKDLGNGMIQLTESGKQAAQAARDTASPSVIANLESARAKVLSQAAFALTSSRKNPDRTGVLHSTSDYTDAITVAKKAANSSVHGTVYVWEKAGPKKHGFSWRLVTKIEPDGFYA
jgi:hypothetical protein